MKKKLISALYSLSLFSTMIFAPEAKAKLGFRDFKNVTRYFKQGKEYNSPTLGQALLESGVVYDLRFDWDFESAYDQNDNRNPIRDHSADPTWNLTKILFPSPAGELAVTTAAATNFGNKVDSPETVAILLNFANQVRAKEQKFRVQMQRQMKQKNFATEEEYFAWAKETGAKKNLFSKKELDQVTDKLLKSMGMEKTQGTEKRDFLKNSINPLLIAIQGSIQEEYKPSTLIPMHLTEEILNAFFVQKFNSQDDILVLMRNLDDDIVDKSSLPEKLEKLEKQDLPLIAHKEAPFDYDEFYALAHAGSFFEMTPYPDGTPASNESAYLYDRKQDRLVESETFPDCVETSMRHLMNLLLYDAETKTFQVDQLKERFPAEEYPYLKNLFDFYELQSPEDANNGTINFRSAWNRVVADLNAQNGTPNEIHYQQNGNNIATGFINVIRVFQKIFGLHLDPFPENEEINIEEDWIKNSLQTIFQAINPDRQYEITSVKFLMQNDAGLKVEVTLPNKNSSFSFEYNALSMHTSINNIKGTQEGQYCDYIYALANNATTSEIDNAAEGIIWRLTLKGIADEHIKPIWWLTPNEIADKDIKKNLFQLFSYKLNDTESRIPFIGSFSQGFELWKNHPMYPKMRSILKHVLDEASWNDAYAVNKMSPLIISFLEDEELRTVLARRVKLLKFYNLPRFSANLNTEHFPQLESLSIVNSPNVRILGAENLVNLREVSASDQNQIPECPSVRKITLDPYTGNEDLSTFIRRNLPNLESLQFRNIPDNSKDNSHFKRENFDIQNLSTLQNFSFFPSSDQNDPQNVSLQNLPKLRKMTISGVASKKRYLGSVTLRNLPQVETVDLGCTPTASLILDDMASLKRVEASSTESIKLNRLETLVELNLANTKNLSDLSLKDLPKLHYLDLEGSHVRRLYLENLDSLDFLFLSDMPYLESITFEGSFTKFCELELRNCPNLRTLEGLDKLQYIRSLDVSGCFPRTRVVGLRSKAKLYADDE